MLENGADWQLFAADTKLENHTPLHYAIGKDATGLITKILDSPLKETYLNVQDSEGCTPLILAAKNNKIEYCEMLINAGADQDISDKSGKTAKDYLEGKQ